MKLLQRLLFAIKYDINREFIVYSIPNQGAIRFLSYEDARKFSNEQIQYRPAVMVKVERIRRINEI